MKANSFCDCKREEEEKVKEDLFSNSKLTLRTVFKMLFLVLLLFLLSCVALQVKALKALPSLCANLSVA